MIDWQPLSFVQLWYYYVITSMHCYVIMLCNFHITYVMQYYAIICILPTVNDCIKYALIVE